MSKSLGSAKLGVCLFIAGFIFLSDRLSKFIVTETMRIGDVVCVFPFFNIVRIENTGLTFGFLSDVIHPSLLVAASLFVIAALCVWTKRNRQYMLPACMIIGGAFGNLIDRITSKAVIDFLDFHLLTWHWPAFNIADSAIVIGLAVLFFVSYGEEES
jgi:signal peptidase II